MGEGMTLNLKGLNGDAVTISEDQLEALQGQLRGALIQPGDAGYDESRTLWNAMHDRKPGLVVRALGTGDIRAAVNFARENKLRIAVKGGGHQIAGLAVADGALLLDLGQMRAVHVDPDARTVQVDPGALLSDIDRETELYGLAMPLGINSTTGISGFTLGGGFGWTTRKFGLTIDNLLSAIVVTADGKILRTSETEHPDLFWAIRGGGGNFGVVASFEFRLHRLGPEILSGLIVHPMDDAPELMAKWRDICAKAPDELTVWTVLRKAPPLPFLPEEWHGREILVFGACYAGDMAEGEVAMKELRSLGNPIADVISPHPLHGWQAAFDPLLTPGARNYWKSHDFTSFSDEAIAVILDAARNLPDPQTEIALAHLGGAMTRVAPDAMAWPQRAAHFTMNVHTRWEDPAKDDHCIGWARGLFDDSAPYSAGTVYVNFIPGDEEGRVREAYGDNLDRLRKVKATYDPENLFRVNHNIEPEVVAHAAQ